MRRAMFLAVLIVPAVMQGADCRLPGATPVQNRVLGYRDLGNRCEGFYEAKVANTATVELVSLVRGALPEDLRSPRVLSLTTRATRRLTIRAVPLRRAIYYRMEAKVEPRTMLVWPTSDILARSDIPGRFLGIIGEIDAAEESSPLYVPVSIDGSKAAPTAAFRAGRPLTAIRWRLKSIAGGRCAAPAAWQTVSETDDDGRIIRVRLPDQPSYCVEIIGVDGDRPVSATFHIEAAP